MANEYEFRLEADELQRVANGLHDIHSQIQDIVSTTRGQLAAEGTPWQFNGAPAGIQAQIEETQDALDPSKPKRVGAQVGDLAEFLDSVVQVFPERDRA